MYVCAPHGCLIPGGRERMLDDPLELGFRCLWAARWVLVIIGPLEEKPVLISPSLFVLKDIKNASNFVFSQVNNHSCQHAVSYQINYPFAIWNLLIEKDLYRSNTYLVVCVCVFCMYMRMWRSKEEATYLSAYLIHLRQGLPLNQKLVISARLPGQWALISARLSPSRWGSGYR